MSSTGLETKSGSAAPVALTRDRILDVVEELFAERGLAGTSVRDIAARIDLTPASLYNHFPGKQALYEAVLERGVRPLLVLMQGLAAPAEGADSADEIISAIMQHLNQRPHLPRLIHHEAVTGGEHLAGLARDWIRPLMEQGIAEMERRRDSNWEHDEFELVIAAWIHVVFGHFAMASLLREVFEEDPLSPRGLERQTRFLRKLARLMGNPATPGDMRARDPKPTSEEDVG